MTLSKAQLKKLDEQRAAERSETQAIAARQNDLRVRAFEGDVVVSEDTLSAIQEVVGKGDGRIADIVRTRADVVHNWANAGQSFLAIGRALRSLDLKLSLTDEQKRKLQVNTKRIFPFSDQIASMLRKVAEFAEKLDDGASKLPITSKSLPGSYATSYAISTMAADELLAAVELKLIRPDVTRPAIQNFLTEFRTAKGPRPVRKAKPISLQILREKRAKLVADLARIDQLIALAEKHPGKK